MSQKARKTQKFTTQADETIEFTTLGFGAAPLGNYRRALSEAEADETLNAAWDAGLRYFDTAPLYGFGLSEQRVGRMLAGRNRSDYTLSSKVGRLLERVPEEEADGMIFVDIPPYKFVYDYSYDGVMRSYEESLKRIGVDRLDILYVHDIDAFNHGGRSEAEARTRELIDEGGWKALSELRSSGDVKAIGVGVNEWEPCAMMLDLADPDIFLLAGRYTLMEHEPLTKLFPECERRGVGVVIGGPYNSGVLVGGETYNYGDIPEDVAAQVRKLAGVCDRHKVRMPAAALQFVLAHPVVPCVIPGPMSVEETLSNVDLLDDQIPADFWSDLKQEGLIPEFAPVPESETSPVS